MTNGGHNPDFPLKTGEVTNALLIRRGDIPGAVDFNRADFSDVIGTTLMTFWDDPSNLIYLASAETMDISSTSANDTLAGTGARVVFIQGVDANYDQIQEVVLMNGTTPVTTVQSFLRVNTFLNVVAGSGTINEGRISAIASTAGTLQSFFDPGVGSTFSLHFTVPAGKTWFVNSSHAQSGKAGEIKLLLFLRPFGGAFFAPIQFHVYQNTADNLAAGGFSASERSDVEVRAINAAGGSGSATIQVNAVLIDNDAKLI